MKAIKIDAQGFYLEDIPFYEGKQTETIILEPPPEGLWHPRWNGSEWEEGLSFEEIAARQAVRPAVPDFRLLKQKLTPLYSKNLGDILASSQASFFMSALDTELNSAIPSAHNLQFKLEGLVAALGSSLSDDDLTAINLAVRNSGFDFELTGR